MRAVRMALAPVMSSRRWLAAEAVLAWHGVRRPEFGTPFGGRPAAKAPQYVTRILHKLYFVKKIVNAPATDPRIE